MKSDLNQLGLKAKWMDLTEGMSIAGSGTSKEFCTGEWSEVKPEWIQESCRQCLLCTPVCPDSCIPVLDGKRGEFDVMHCKGCGICVKACPFGAIKMEGVN